MIFLCFLAVLAQPGASLASAKAGSESSSPAENKANALGLGVSSTPAAALDHSGGTAETSKHRLPPKSLNSCSPLGATLCHAVHDKPVLALTAIQAGLLVSDGVTTRQVIHHGYFEIDPVARIFIGTKPTWGCMAPIGTVQVIAETWLAEHMRTSRHIWTRRFWWAPQMTGIAANAWATGHNLSLPK